MESIIEKVERWNKKYLKARYEKHSIIEEFLFDSRDRPNTPISNQEIKEWALYKSIINMLDFYRTELRALMKGKSIVNSIPLGTRIRFVEHGILRRFGSKFEFTDIGREMLQSSVFK